VALATMILLMIVLKIVLAHEVGLLLQTIVEHVMIMQTMIVLKIVMVNGAAML
jgi:hypothetical protein